MPPAPTQFSIHPSSGVPIYRQLIDQVLALIASGRLDTDDPLPSVRALAQSLEVNPMTVSKAYARLEAQGVLKRLRGRGMVVATTGPRSKRPRLAARETEVRPLIEQAVLRARQLNLTDRQFLALAQTLLKNNPQEVPRD